MKTLDINTIEWFDKVNGNTYFASRLTVNYGLDETLKKEHVYSPSEYYEEKEFVLPFQYGYGSQSEYEAVKTLKENGYFPECKNTGLYRFCEENNIILRVNKRSGLKRELKNI